MLVYVRLYDRCSSAHPQKSRDHGRLGDSKQYPAGLLPGPLQKPDNPSKTHLHKPRETQMHNGRQEPRLRTLEEQTPYLSSSQDCPRRPSAPVSRCETHHHEPLGAALQVAFQTKGGCCLVGGHMMGCKGRASHRSPDGISGRNQR